MFENVPAGRAHLTFALDGLETANATVWIEDRANVVDDAAMRAPELAETITLSCGRCGGPPEDSWDLPDCRDDDAVSILIEAAGRGDPSAVALLRSRYETATTYRERQRVGGALLTRVADGRAIWNELYDDAQNAVRFARNDSTLPPELEAWALARALDPEAYAAKAHYALETIAADPRARALLLRALETEDVSLVWTATRGLVEQRDRSALAKIADAIERFPEHAAVLRELLADAIGRLEPR